MERAQARAGAHGMDFVFQLISTAAHAALPAPLRDTIEDGRIHGVLGVGINDPAAKWLEERVPFVNFAGPGPRFALLVAADAVRDAVQTLTARGCRRLSFWLSFAPGIEIKEADERETVAAFQAELEELGRGARARGNLPMPPSGDGRPAEPANDAAGAGLYIGVGAIRAAQSPRRPYYR